VAYSKNTAERYVLAAWLVAVFAISALTDFVTLGIVFGVAIALLWRGSLTALRKVLVTVIPLTVALSIASFGWLRMLQGTWPDWRPYTALSGRAALIAFITFSVLARVNLLRALSRWPTLIRLLVIVLAQIHALRLLLTESRLGLQSRLIRKPRAADLVRNAGGVTGALFSLTMRNAREISDAMRSRGF
jgi:cobalt/nickel transport system permease protein